MSAQSPAEPKGSRMKPHYIAAQSRIENGILAATTPRADYLAPINRQNSNKAKKSALNIASASNREKPLGMITPHSTQFAVIPTIADAAHCRKSP